VIYNPRVIAERINAQREKFDSAKREGLGLVKRGKPGLTKEELAFALERERSVIGKWTNPNPEKWRVPSMADFINMCNLFDCELGYLLGEHEGETREQTDIAESTGLSLEAVECLTSERRFQNEYMAYFWDELLKNKELYNVFSNCIGVLDFVRNGKLNVNMYDGDGLIERGAKISRDSEFKISIDNIEGRFVIEEEAIISGALFRLQKHFMEFIESYIETYHRVESEILEEVSKEVSKDRTSAEEDFKDEIFEEVD